jgi:trk system potassium uptake protein TrkH
MRFLRESTYFMMICLMFIGGSPGSIAGGIKTTTIGVVILLIYSKFK